MAKLLAHKLLGVAVAYYVLRPGNLMQAFMYGGLVLLGSMVSDLDGLRGHVDHHRRILHNILACILTGTAVYVALLVADKYTYEPAPDQPIPAGIHAIISYILAYVSHLLADMPTGSGVAILYSLSNKKIGILGLRYDNVVYNALLIALATLLLYSFLTIVGERPILHG